MIAGKRDESYLAREERPVEKENRMDGYDYCRYLALKIGNRWTGSPGERRAGDWIETQLARMGYETRQTRFECPAWEYDGEELFLGNEPVVAGAQFFSAPCSVQGKLAAIEPDRKGGFSGDVKGKIALCREEQTNDVNDRNAMLCSLEKAGALAAIIVSTCEDTYSTKLFRTPESRLGSVAVSAWDGAKLYAGLDKPVKLVIRAKQTQGTTSNVIGEKGPSDGPVIMVSAHHEATPDSPGALDNASGVGAALAMAEAFAKIKTTARLRFCTFGGHEFGGLGSRLYVSRCADELKRYKRMLNFDGAGMKGRKLDLAVYGPEGLVERMRRFAGDYPDVMVSNPMHHVIGDNVPFVEAGLETVWLRGARDESSHIAGFPGHSPDDDMRWVNREALSRYVEIGTAMLKNWMTEFGSA